MKAMRHKCKNKPSAVTVRESWADGSWSWVIDYNESEYMGSDRKVWSKTAVLIPIKLCPWCGEKLEMRDE